MSYVDRADIHFLGEGFPENVPQENGGTHIGMYLAWIINNDLTGEFHIEESKESIKALKERKITGRDFLIKECDSKLGEEDISDEGMDFTDSYYGDGHEANQYIYDYAEMFVKEQMSFYDVEDTWANYDKISLVIDERFRSWKAVRKIYDQQKS
jgi:hypothetical protein